MALWHCATTSLKTTIRAAATRGRHLEKKSYLAMMPATLLLVASLYITLIAAAWWQPPVNTTWQIVLSAPLTPPYTTPTTNRTITALDGDLFENAANHTWAAVKAAGYRTICYFSAGSYEDWRPDVARFLPADLGDPLDGWPGERWLDTRSQNVRTIMRSRLDLAVKQGCDAVDPDNIDAYDNDGGGLDLTAADAISYVRFLAQEAHSRGLAMGLKNGGAIVPNVLNVTDFQVNEQCVQYDECETFRQFIDAGKPVFGIEYTKKDSDEPTRSSNFVKKICAKPERKRFETLIKHMNLDEWGISCEDDGTSAMNATGAANGTAVPAMVSRNSSGRLASVLSLGGCDTVTAAAVLLVGLAASVAWLL
ncbi:hypothetical protein LTR53_007010 [Teratosphaeriaceae sp. CCFEE 6253]|nr:hypothetical protein LTR53_007010 [Teratosphaeriaceae sp. CCFEE 6253]